MTEDQYTNQLFMLPVGGGHELWVHDWGNPDAKTPLFFLHGGPGSHCKDKHKFPFDPTTQRVIFHDQRGSGQSLPAGKLGHNTTQELAADITRIADRLGIKQFIITGASWGSTLALYYAVMNPERVSAVVVSGIWFASEAEDAYMNGGGWRTHFPDLWDWYLSTVPEEYRQDPSAYHFAQALGDDPEKAAKSARIFGDMEAGLISLDDRHAPTPAEDYDPAGSLIEMHYMAEHCFMPDRYLLDNAHKLTMPVHIVQGRYDFVCPPANAYELHTAVPHSTLTWVTSGHASEHETVTALSLIYHQLAC
jgi:proline iminopeptidase